MAAEIGRREFLAGAAALAAGARGLPTWREDGPGMHGLIGRMTAVPGERDQLVEILLEGILGLPVGGHGL